MTTQAVDTASEATGIEDAGRPAGATRRGAQTGQRRSRWWFPRRTGQRTPAHPRGGRMSITVLAGAIRLLVLVADYLLAFVTATVVIPELAVWLHRTSGAGSGKLTIDGTVAMWAVPLVFLVAILTVGEIAVMRALWQWASRAIRTIRDRRSAAEPTLARTGRRRATRKQKKRT